MYDNSFEDSVCRGHRHRDGHCCEDGVRGELTETYFGIRLDESAKHAWCVCDGFFLYLFSFSPSSFVTIVFSKRRQTCTTRICVPISQDSRSHTVVHSRWNAKASWRYYGKLIYAYSYYTTAHYYRFARVNWQQWLVRITPVIAERLALSTPYRTRSVCRWVGDARKRTRFGQDTVMISGGQ